MAFSFIQRAGSANPSITVTAGNTVVAFIEWWDTTTVPTVLSGNGNTWIHPTGAHAQNGAGGVLNTDVFYVLSANAGSTSVTVTWSGSSPSGGFAVHLIEIHPAGTPTFDKVSTAFSGTNVTVSDSDLVTANDNEVVLSGNMNASGVTLAPSGWATELKTTAAFFEYSSYLLDAGAAGTKNIDWDFQANSTYAQTNIAFRDVVAGGPTNLGLSTIGRGAFEGMMRGGR